jgi:uncharacterized protein (DUF1778 family)
MRNLHKKQQTNIRWTPAQLKEIERAARIESQRRGEVVERAALIRELALLGVEQILAKHEAAA